MIEGSEKLFALSLDKAESVERVEEASVSDVPDIMTDACRQLVRGVAGRKKGQQMVLLPDVDPLFDDAGDIAAKAATEPRQQETTCL